MRKLSTLLLTTALLTSVAFQPVLADEWRHHDDIHRFHDHDFDHWRGGNWYHGFHDGRDGWWWIVDGGWYFYPAPVYPYPDPYTPPAVVVETPAPAGVQAYYYCASPAGYYPYVPQCAVAWQRVVQGAAPSPQVVVPTPAPAPAVMAPAPGQRDIDLQKLNTYAIELQNISPADPQARVRLKTLSRQVETLRKIVAKREYNPISMLQNIDDLKKRIAAKRSSLNAPPAAVIMPAPTTAPAPLPPGSTVTFPPQ